MSGQKAPCPTRAEIESKGARLAVRVHNEPSEVERAEIMAWVAERPEHAVAFARAESAWTQSERLKALGPELPADADIDGEAKAEKRSVNRRLALGAMAAASAAIAIPVALIRSPHAERFTTARGEVREVKLADGSRAQLNTDSQIEVAFRDDHRLIRLLRGEASFDVAHDPNRPFDVDAGGDVVRAIGTSFTVNRRAGGIDLTVSEGVVALRSDTGGSARVAAGNAATVERGKIVTTAIDPNSIRRQNAWHQGMIELEGLSVGEAVAQFNRYRRSPIIVTDPAIASLRLGGRFGLDESEQFLVALRASFGLRTEHRPDGTVLVESGR